MKVFWPFAVALTLPFVQACSRTTQPATTEPKPLDAACRAAVAASAGSDTDIPGLQQALRERRAPALAAEQLGYRLIARARLTNDAGFYTLAEQAALCMASLEPADPGALLLRGHVLHQMHRFGEAESIARRLVALREFVLDHGLLGDVLMEQGRLGEAATAYQKMIDLKPFYQSYTRAAHLRWLKGDLEGAIEMMQAAIRAVSPRDPESVAWAYSRLAFYELQRGRLAEAERMADASLRYVPDYAAALLVRGRIQLAERRPLEAVTTLERAAERNPLPEYKWAHADALRAVNRIDDARVVEQQLTAAGSDDPRTVALYLATRQENRPQAIALARQELQKRADVFTLDTLAWALASAGEIREASALIARALAEGTQDGRLFLHAAAIAAADGRARDAKRWAGKARALQFTLLPSELGVLRTGIATPPDHEVMAMKKVLRMLPLTAAAGLLLWPATAQASSHMDAPLITLDDAANTTDVYAFVSQRFGGKYLTTALAVYPHEEPGIGPNKYNFDDDVLYEIRVATGTDVGKGRTTHSYQFRFDTSYRNRNTILQSYLGVVANVGDASQNLIQRYTVDRVDWRTGSVDRLGRGIVPPNNQGNATPKYNQMDNGEQPAKDGVGDEANLDLYTSQSVATLEDGYFAFAGQRDDGFYADVQAIFDLLKLRPADKAVDSQGGFNVHTIALNIPIDALGGDQQIVGVYATTSRRRVRVLGPAGDANFGEFVQVARQGNPLFNEGLVAIKDKDLYSRTSPEVDATIFQKYALTPELAGLINALVLGANVAPTMNRTDIAGIFIPDLIKVDLSTGPARLAGGGPTHPTNPDDAGFSRLSIFGGDTLTSSVQPGFGNGTVPGGWPNGRRFGDDVVDIAVTALISDLRVSPPKIVGPAGDNVNANDIAYNKVFPYAATPLNGRNHTH